MAKNSVSQEIEHAEMKCCRGVDDPIIELWEGAANTTLARRLLLGYAEYARKSDAINHQDLLNKVQNSEKSLKTVRIPLRIPKAEFPELYALWQGIAEGLKSYIFILMIKHAMTEMKNGGKQLKLSELVATGPGEQWGAGAPSRDGLMVEEIPQQEITISDMEQYQEKTVEAEEQVIHAPAVDPLASLAGSFSELS